MSDWSCKWRSESGRRVLELLGLLDVLLFEQRGVVGNLFYFDLMFCGVEVVL